MAIAAASAGDRSSFEHTDSLCILAQCHTAAFELSNDSPCFRFSLSTSICQGWVKPNEAYRRTSGVTSSVRTDAGRRQIPRASAPS